MGFAVIARDEHIGREKVLSAFEKYLFDARNRVRTPVSAFAFDEEGRVVASCHVPFPPHDQYGPFPEER